MEVWNIIFLSKWVMCRFHVNLPGCIDYRFCQETFDAGRYCDIPSFEFAPKGLEKSCRKVGGWKSQPLWNILHPWNLLVGGFNPFEKYYSNWIISPGRVEHIKCLKPPPSLTWNLKGSPWKRRFLLDTLIFRFHVIFRGSSQNGNLPQFCGVKIQKKIFELPPPSCVFEFFSGSRRHFLEGFLGGDVWKNTRYWGEYLRWKVSFCMYFFGGVQSYLLRRWIWMSVSFGTITLPSFPSFFYPPWY